MLSEVQPCFQLLRIWPNPELGSSSPASQDLYTFRPVSANCVFRLGRREDLCDVTLLSEKCPELISRIHAELHAERDEDSPTTDWNVSIVDRSTHGTYINNIRISRNQRVELSDSDMVTFGLCDSNQIPEGAEAIQPKSEFCFLFQKVWVRPDEFDAITTPKAQTSCGFRPVSASGKCLKPQMDRQDFANATSSRATVILNSIGSISKFKSQPLTFHPKSQNHPDDRTESTGKLKFSLSCSQKTERLTDTASVSPNKQRPVCQSKTSRNRRKSAHTVLPELEDEIQRFSEEVQHKRQCKSESDIELHLYSPSRKRERDLTEEEENPHKRQRRETRQTDGHTEGAAKGPFTPTGKRRGRPRKTPLGDVCKVFSQTLYAMEQCAAERCHLPQDDTVEWVQCDDCDAWYHVACVGCNYSAVKEADFHCGCT